MERPDVLELAPGRSALALCLDSEDDTGAALPLLGLETPRPVLVVVGGAGGLAGDELTALEPACGGDRPGGNRSLGDDRGRRHGRRGDAASSAVHAPRAGRRRRSSASSPEALSCRPGEPLVAQAAALEPNHTHFVLVPGSSWGDEAPWLARIAGALAGPEPSVTVLVNGGDIAFVDAAESVAAGRRVLAVAGTNRAADALVAALAGVAGRCPGRGARRLGACRGRLAG